MTVDEAIAALPNRFTVKDIRSIFDCDRDTAIRLVRYAVDDGRFEHDGLAVVWDDYDGRLRSRLTRAYRKVA